MSVIEKKRRKVLDFKTFTALRKIGIVYIKKTSKEDLEKLLDGYRDELVALILKRIPSARLYLFGSRARKTYKEGADIDVAILAEEKIPLSVLHALQDDIWEAPIPVEVDLVDLFNADPRLRSEVERDGVLWTK